MNPPRIPPWLLTRMLSSPSRDSVIGDLVEQYHRGRSWLWFWQQALIAIFLNVFRDVREHKLLVVRAIGVGIAFLWLLGLITMPLSTWVAVSTWNWTVEHNLDAVRVLLYRQGAWLLSVLGAVFTWPLGGWVIARTHRPRGMAMVFAFVVFHHLIFVGQAGWFYSSSSGQPRLSTVLIGQGSWLLATTVYLIAGGLLGSGDGPRHTRYELNRWD